MVFEYKGTDYEFPDDMDDEQALKLIKQDLGEDQTPQPEPTLAQPEPDKYTKDWLGPQIEKRKQEGYEALQKGDMSAGLTAPIKMLGDIAGTATGTVSRAFEPVTKPIGKALAQITPEPIKRGLGKAVEFGAEQYKKLVPEESRELVGSMGNIVGAATLANPLRSEVSTLLRGAAGETGQKLESVGKSLLTSGMKIKDKTATIAGGTPQAGVEKIVNDISKYNIESKSGGFSGIAEKAQNRIDLERQKAQSAISNYSKANPGDVVDVDNTFLKFMDDLENGREPTIFTSETQASDFAAKIHDALSKRGLVGDIPVSKLPEVKKAIDEGLDLFKKGSKNIGADPLPAKVGELAYLRLTKELESKVPEIRESNQAIHDLINVKTAANDAVKRIGNKNKISLSDMAFMLGGAPALAAIGVPATMTGVAPIVAGGIVAKKALSSGRGASMALGAGKTLSKIGEQPFKSKQKVKLAQPITKPEDFLIGKNR